MKVTLKRHVQRTGVFNNKIEYFSKATIEFEEEEKTYLEVYPDLKDTIVISLDNTNDLKKDASDNFWIALIQNIVRTIINIMKSGSKSEMPVHVTVDQLLHSETIASAEQIIALCNQENDFKTAITRFSESFPFLGTPDHEITFNV